MKHPDDNMTCYLRLFVIGVICLLALSGTGRNTGNNSVREIKLTSEVHLPDVRAVLPGGTNFFAILLRVNLPESNRTVNEKNKIAFDSRIFELRFKSLVKSREVIIPFPQLHINFQLIPLRKDDPPALS